MRIQLSIDAELHPELFDILNRLRPRSRAGKVRLMLESAMRKNSTAGSSNVIANEAFVIDVTKQPRTPKSARRPTQGIDGPVALPEEFYFEELDQVSMS